MRSLPHVSEITEAWSRSCYCFVYLWDIGLRSTFTFRHYSKGKAWIGRAAIFVALVAIGLVLFDAPAFGPVDDSPECPVMAITRSRATGCLIRVSRKLSSEAAPWNAPTRVGPVVPLQFHTPGFPASDHNGRSTLTSSLPLRC